MTKKYLFFGLLIGILTGCSTLGLRSGINDEAKGKIKNVAVVSLLGNQFNQVFIGATAFKNNRETADVSAWGIDRFVENSLASALKGNSQFQKIGPVKGLSHTSEYSKEEIATIIQKAKDQGYDTALIMLPSKYDNAPLVMPGYGIHKSSNLFGMTSVDCYLLAVVRVYDTTSGSIEGWQWTFDGISGHPSMACAEKVEWKDQFSEYSPPEQEKIQKILKDHINEVVRYTIGALNLVNQKE